LAAAAGRRSRLNFEDARRYIEHLRPVIAAIPFYVDLSPWRFDRDCYEKFNDVGFPPRRRACVRVPDWAQVAGDTLWLEYSAEMSAEIIIVGRSTSFNSAPPSPYCPSANVIDKQPIRLHCAAFLRQYNKITRS